MHSTERIADRPHLPVGLEGEFTGWRTSSRDSFEINTGPFWHRHAPDGSILCAFRVEKKHLNGAGSVHGGCLMTFADFCLFAIASPVLQGLGVTINFAGDFVDAGREGDLIVGTGEVTRAGRSLLFVRGQLTVEERTLFTFAGTIKRISRTREPQPAA
ncbi:PaaI family thioesterase [Bradyrhizobium sp. 179]|uniref:PaaI family thioesterase n=1 Tax=Bradyrhizobium sp. 179 TaxID=2782648 RepID=UPI001FFA906D|nr:PaaI family thioesterase [Bradyrhizobium sp. 179]MCK1544277.1 PaaI family thioesterase [Bradyrhizobium sp. 179]